MTTDPFWETVAFGIDYAAGIRADNEQTAPALAVSEDVFSRYLLNTLRRNPYVDRRRPNEDE